MTKTTLALVATMTAANAASVSILGNLTTPTLYQSGDSIGGVEVTVTSLGQGEHEWFTFDTGTRLPHDKDLLVNAGPAIAISEKGRFDDEKDGGAITFSFDAPISCFSFRATDVEAGLGLVFYHGDYTPPSLSAMHVTGDAEVSDVIRYEFDTPVTSIDAVFGGSGAIVEPCYTPATSIPEPTTLGLLGLAAIPLLRRTRK